MAIIIIILIASVLPERISGSDGRCGKRPIGFIYGSRYTEAKRYDIISTFGIL